jgi:hypothetical protein
VPFVDVQWIFPIDDQSISVVELLPVNVDTAGGNFQVAVDSVLLTKTLDDFWGSCVPFNGTTVAELAFTLLYNQTGTLGTDGVSVELVSGSISVEIDNNLGFDPIRPAPASLGTMAVTLYDVDTNGHQLAQVMLDGITDALAPPVSLRSRSLCRLARSVRRFSPSSMSPPPRATLS